MYLFRNYGNEGMKRIVGAQESATHTVHTKCTN
jgi:hypothetical protein